MGKPLKKATLGIVGSFLLTAGAAGIVFTMFLQKNPGIAIMIGLFSGSLAVGTGIGTAIRMSSPNRESSDNQAG